ncbi:hypothetical protein C0Q16_29390, partial [Klebsiella pneumoniae]
MTLAHELLNLLMAAMDGRDNPMVMVKAGAITWWLYDDPQLGGVMTLAHELLNLLMAAMDGRDNPMVMVKAGA